MQAPNDDICRRVMPGSELDSKVQRKGKVIRKVAYPASIHTLSYSYS